MNLITVWYPGSDRLVSIPQRKSSYTRSKIPLNDYGYSSRMIVLSNDFVQLGFFKKYTGYFDREKKHGMQTRFEMTDNLIALFDKHFTSFEEAPFVILPLIEQRNSDKKPLSFEETDYTKEMLAELEAYNALLQKTSISCTSTEVSYNEYKPIYIRRIFNNGSFDHGGRFYGGQWQQLTSTQRGCIKINGKSCVEIDYSALHICMMYAEMEKSYSSDPYKISVPIEDDPKKARKIIKKSFLTLINAGNRKEAIKAIRSDLVEMGGYSNLSDTLINEMIQNIEERHPAIRQYFMSGKGVELMKKDSEIARIVINHFTQQEVPVLCVHDSFIVQEGYEAELREVMQSAYGKFYPGHTIGLK